VKSHEDEERTEQVLSPMQGTYATYRVHWKGWQEKKYVRRGAADGPQKERLWIIPKGHSEEVRKDDKEDCSEAEM
jgi:hypothetical protein